jgi:hypothetical protein
MIKTIVIGAGVMGASVADPITRADEFCMASAGSIPVRSYSPVCCGDWSGVTLIAI